MTIELTIIGMSCGGCAASLQKALLAHPAITEARVDFTSGTATIESNLDRSELIALIEAQQFSVG